MASSVYLTLYEDTSDDQIEIYQPSISASYWSSGFYDKDEDDDDTEYAVTIWGTKITYDSEDKQEVLIEHPAEQVYGNVFVSETSVS